MNAVQEIESPPPKPDEWIQMVAVMSVPMCGWNPHWECHSLALRPFGIADTVITYGAWWDHGICNAFEDILERESPVDWILTMDYDSMFTLEHVNKLRQTFGDNPHIDALTVIQPRRGDEETAIIGFDAADDDGSGVIEFTDQPIKCASAHFGLTLFRVEALRRMPKPYMVHQPDPNGSYRTKARLDPDMYFWHKWKECGNTLYVDPTICIGHLQPMVAEMHRDDDGFLKTRHVHVFDWRKRRLGGAA